MENQKLNIGKNISTLRKQKGVTQEALADAVGVSAQAVSKWEGGGAPDVELLPGIADYFGVPIDQLFGREAVNLNDMGSVVEKYFTQLPLEERIPKMFELCWKMHFTVMMRMVPIPLQDLEGVEMPSFDISGTYSSEVISALLVDQGIALLGMCNSLRLFLFMPQAEEGWGKHLRYKDEYTEMLAFLADVDTLKTIFMLYEKEGTKAFAARLVEKQLGISAAKATKILERLKDYKMLKSFEVELDNGVETIYELDLNPAFIPFLALLDNISNRPGHMYGIFDTREKPYLYTTEGGTQ